LTAAPASARDRPDLKVVAVSDVPAAAAAGAGFEVVDKTKNVGTKKAPASVTGFFVSVDSIKSGDDTPLVGTHGVPRLNPRRADSATTPVTIPDAVAPGNYRLIACADMESTVREPAKNNCLPAGGTLEVLTPGVTAYEINQGAVADGTEVSLDGLQVSALKTEPNLTTIYAQESAGGQYGGLRIVVPDEITLPSGLAPGDVIDTVGELTTFDLGVPISDPPTGIGIRQVESGSVARTLAGGPEPAPLVIGAAALSGANARDQYSGLLVQVQDVMLTVKELSRWTLVETETSAVARADDALIGTLPDYPIEANFDAVTGVGYYDFFDEEMRFAPRTLADIDPA
jgi:hypothetical protein